MKNILLSPEKKYQRALICKTFMLNAHKFSNRNAVLKTSGNFLDYSNAGFSFKRNLG